MNIPPLRCVIAVAGEVPDHAETNVVGLGNKGSFSWLAVPVFEAEKWLLKHASTVKFLYLTESEMNKELEGLEEMDIFEAITRRITDPDIPLLESFEHLARYYAIVAAGVLAERDAATSATEKEPLNIAVECLCKAVNPFLDPFPQPFTLRESLSFAINAQVELTGLAKELSVSRNALIAKAGEISLSTADAAYTDLAQCCKEAGEDAYSTAPLADNSEQVCAVLCGNPLAKAAMVSQSVSYESWNGYWLTPCTAKKTVRSGSVVLYLSPGEQSEFDGRHTISQVNLLRTRRLKAGGPEGMELAAYAVQQRLRLIGAIGTILREASEEGKLPEAIARRLRALYERELMVTALMIKTVPALMGDMTVLPSMVTLSSLKPMLSVVLAAASVPGMESFRKVVMASGEDILAAEKILK